MAQKPQILDRHIVAQSRLFTIETMDLKFSNGIERTYERLIPGGAGAVMMVPINAKGEVLLIREYGAGAEDYTLTLPKGAIDLGETIEQAAERELKEDGNSLGTWWRARKSLAVSLASRQSPQFYFNQQNSTA